MRTVKYKAATDVAAADAATKSTPESSRVTGGARVKALVRSHGLVLSWIAIIVLFGAIEPSKFLTWPNFSTMLGTQAVLLVLALGLIVPLISGDYDLSVAGTLTFSSMLTAVLNVERHWPIGVTILVVLVVSASIGLFNGLVATVFKIEVLIVTLGSGTLLSGLTLWVSNSATISGVSQGLVNWTVVHQVGRLPLQFFYAIVLAAVLWYVTNYTAAGRRLLFVGKSRRVSRLSGIYVSRVRVLALVAAGLIAGLAGILYTGTSGSADPTSGTTYLLPAFAAAFLGSTAIVPGRFNPWGTVIAVYFLVTGITGLQLLGVQPFVQNLFYGSTLILAVVLSRLASRRERSEDD